MSWSVSKRKKIKYLYIDGGPTQFGAIAVVHNFLCADECQHIVDIAENFGFSPSDPKDSYEQSTVDIEVDSCDPLRHMLLNMKFIDEIKRYMLWVYGVPITAFDDVFVVKYDANHQKDLVRHCDGGHISFMITLSDAASYTGGGTHFDLLGNLSHDAIPCNDREGEGVIKAAQGDLILFNAGFYHQAMPITTGLRYMFVGFCYVDNEAARQRGNISLRLRKI